MPVPTGKADLAFKCENMGMLSNACIICQFNLVSMSMEDLLAMMKVSTGFDYDLDELMECGERIWLTKRAINNLMGVTKADDRMTERMLTAFTDGGAAGSVPDMELMLKEYYPIRGLDDNGRPTKEKLESLGMADVAAKLGL